MSKSRNTACRASFTLRGSSIERGLNAVRIVKGRVRISGSDDGSWATSPSSDARGGPVCAFPTHIPPRPGGPAAAIARGTRALEIAGRRGDLRLRIVATTYLEQAHYYRGEYTRVIELARDNLAALRPEWSHEFFGGSQPPAVNDRFRLIASLAPLGRFAEAAGHEAEAIRLAEETRHAYTVAVAYHAAATLHSIRGDWATARAPSEMAAEAAQAGGDRPRREAKPQDDASFLCAQDRRRAEQGDGPMPFSS